MISIFMWKMLCRNSFMSPILQYFGDKFLFSDCQYSNNGRNLLINDIYTFSSKLFQTFVLILVYTLFFNNITEQDDGSCSLNKTEIECLNVNNLPKCVWFDSGVDIAINQCFWADSNVDAHTLFLLILLSMTLSILIRSLPLKGLIDYYLINKYYLKSIFQFEYPNIHVSQRKTKSVQIDPFDIVNDNLFSENIENKSDCNSNQSRKDKIFIGSATKLMRLFEQYTSTISVKQKDILDHEWSNQFRDESIHLSNKFKFRSFIKHNQQNDNYNKSNGKAPLLYFMEKNIISTNQSVKVLNDEISLLPKANFDILLNMVLLFYFMIDIIGINTKEAIIFAKVVNKNMKNKFIKIEKNSSLIYRMTICLVLIVICVVVMLFCLRTQSTNTSNIQWTWAVGITSAVLFDILILQMIEFTWEHIILPLSIQNNIEKAKIDIEYKCKKLVQGVGSSSDLISDDERPLSFSFFFFSYRLSMQFENLYISRLILSYYKGIPDNYRIFNNIGSHPLLLFRTPLITFCALLPINIQRVIISYVVIFVAWLFSIIISFMVRDLTAGTITLIIFIIFILVFCSFLKNAVLNSASRSNNQIMVENDTDYELFIESRESFKDKITSDSDIEIDIQLDEVDSLQSISLPSYVSSLADNNENRNKRYNSSRSESHHSSNKSIQLSEE